MSSRFIGDTAFPKSDERKLDEHATLGLIGHGLVQRRGCQVTMQSLREKDGRKRNIFADRYADGIPFCQKISLAACTSAMTVIATHGRFIFLYMTTGQRESADILSRRRRAGLMGSL